MARRPKKNKRKPNARRSVAEGASVSSADDGASTTKLTKNELGDAGAGPDASDVDSSEDGGLPPSLMPAPKGWIAVLVVVVGGALLGFSQPFVLSSVGETPVLPPISGLLAFVGWVPLFVVIRTSGPKRAYWFAFLSVFVQMWIILYWIIIAMTVFGGIPLLPSMFALSSLAAAIGFGIAAPFAVAHIICRQFHWPYWLVAPVAVTGLELIRNNGPFGGFPWGTLGNSLASIPILLQGASLFGVYGLLFCIVLVNAALAEIVVAAFERRLRFDLPPRVIVAVAILLVGWGAYRLSTAPDATSPTVRVALLQPNIEQGIKSKKRKSRREILKTFHSLQQDALKRGAEIVAWPEASLPSNVGMNAKSLKTKGVLRKRGTTGDLVPPAGIIGATASYRVKDEKGHTNYAHYNTAFATTKDLKIVGRFDKAKLVPFGEYIPWPLRGVVAHFVPSSSIAGEGLHPVTIDVNGRNISVATTICYEGAFPEISRDLANEGAELMFNVTNDAWYGISSMARQHLSMYSIRATENSRAVARVANTGISAWIDSRGGIHAQTKMYEEASEVSDVPLVTGTTPYRVLGEWVAYPCMLLTLLLWFIALTRPGRWPRKKPEWVVTVGGGLMVVGALLPVYADGGYLDGGEAVMTQRTLSVIVGLLVSLGAFSGRPWGRRAQIIVAVLALFLLTPGLFLGAPAVIPFEIFLVGAGIVAFRRREQYGPRDDNIF